MSFLRQYRLGVVCLAFSLLLLIGSVGMAAGLPDFTKLVEDNSAAVVNISTKQKVALHHPRIKGFEMPEIPEDSPLNDLFRHFFSEPNGDDSEEGQRDYDSRSLGSGFIISKDGYLLTNHHVADGADEILVRLSDRREFVARVVGSDKRSDIALLKIDADDLPVVKVGRSADLKVGEWVLAIGSPFGFDHSVTQGIVSAKGRSLPSDSYVPFIQTDVAINPGNSGGPLFDLDGNVVGVNSQIYSRTGGFMGLSFAIPIEMAMDVAEQLKSKGHVTRGWLGVLIQDVTRELAESFGMETPHGALVAKVLDGSPAEKSGIRVGDIITAFDGKRINNSSVLPPLVGATPVGHQVDLEVIREGKTIHMPFAIGELPTEEQLQLTSSVEQDTSRDSRIGLTVADLTAEQRKQLEIEGGRGVLVESVKEGPAYRAGIRQGDVLLMINNAEIKDVTGFDKLVAELPDDATVPVLVQRRSGPLFLALKLADK